VPFSDGHFRLEVPAWRLQSISGHFLFFCLISLFLLPIHLLATYLISIFPEYIKKKLTTQPGSMLRLVSLTEYNFVIQKPMISFWEEVKFFMA
jgi:hypothetical protein